MLGFTGLLILYLYPKFFLLGPLRDVNLSVDLITYFTVIQTDTFPHINIAYHTAHAQ